MKAVPLCGRVLVAPVVVLGLLMSAAPAAADPQTEGPAPSPDVPAELAADAPAANAAVPVAPDTGAAVVDACRQFGAALDFAATNYEDFAYATAGGGNAVNYQDPSVQSSNVVGRTALREAAGAAMTAAGTPGLPAEVSAPMQSWSLHATKLILIMGLRGGGDSLNSAANDLNTDADNAQLACALNGGRA